MKVNEGDIKIKGLGFPGQIWMLATLMLLLSVFDSYGSGTTSHIGNDTTVCSGKCITLSSNISGTYLWSTGAKGSTITVCPASDATITLVTNNLSGIYYDTVHITVDKYCVWPGDANENGTVNNSDVLKIGLAFGATGSARANVGNDWTEQHADNWSKSFRSGLNFKYADCNGDGVVDLKDLDAIKANWSKTHNKAVDTIYDASNSHLFFVPNKDTVSAGDTLALSIYLGTLVSPVSAVYGVSFTYHFAPNSVVPGSMNLSVNTDNCWLNNSGGHVISNLNADYVNKTADVAISRTNGIAINGYGKIGVLSIIIADNVGKRPLNGQLHMSFANVEAISSNETNIPLTPVSGSVYYSEARSAVKDVNKPNDRVDIYPNPVSSNSIHINVNDIKAEKIEVLDIVGNLVFTAAKPFTGDSQFNLPSLKHGLYMIHIYTAQGCVSRKININN